ncbi:AAA domain-containing protein [Neobacillus sp. NPDC093127]|uniref:AAA domain-containing protein n=1 Tax=Neobacillus sp. NPDC093127 TaxID=3364296 RepID=UPI00380EBA79
MQLVSKLKQYQDKLNDLGKDNKSIRFIQFNKSYIDLSTMPKGRVSIFELLDHIIRHRQTNGLKVTESKSPLMKETRWTNKLKDLYKEWNTRHMETGERDLFVGFPFLSGTLHDGTFIHGPLLFYPVELSKKDGDWFLSFEEDGEVIWNRALMLAIQQANEIKITESQLEQALPLKDSYDLDSYLKTLWDWGIPLHSPQPKEDLLLVSLEDNVKLLKDAVAEGDSGKKFTWDQVKTPLTLVPHAILGKFSQGKKGISKDYQALIKEVEQGEKAELVAALLNEMTLELGETDEKKVLNVDDGNEEEHLFLLDSDSSQEEVILSARFERGLVVDGPPGSGKSQVIVNLIADTLRVGKPVLLVAEKKAALTVVMQRLQEVGLEEFVALVHNDKDDRKSLYEKIVKNVQGQPEAGYEQVKQEYIHCSQQIAAKTTYIKGIANTLWESQSNGLSLFRMYDRALKYRGRESIFRPPSQGYDMKIHELDKLKGKLERLGRYAMRYRHREHPWSKRKCMAEWNLEQRNKWLDALGSLLAKEEQEAQGRKQFEIWGLPLSYLVRNGQGFDQGQRLLRRAMDRKWFAKWFWNRWVKKYHDVVERLGGSSELEWDKLLEQFSNLGVWRGTREQVEHHIQGLSAIFPEDHLQDQLQRWKQGESLRDWLEGLRESLLSDWDDMKQMDREEMSLSPTERLIFENCMQVLPPTKEQSQGPLWYEQVEQAYLDYWIHLAEEGNPRVKDVSEEEYEIQRQQYGSLLKRKQEVAAAYLKLKLQQEVAEIPEKERSDIAYRSGLKNKTWPIRKLLQEYPDILAKVMPVWLVSPSVASSIFPLVKEMFDLVIFDEASQCPAEYGIPALYRGRRIIVAGDEKQLKPTMIGMKIYEMDEDDEDYYEDIQMADSLLDLAKRNFKRKPLEWHYRSKYEELINFSNHAFYKNIQVAPNVLPTQNPPAIQWFHVENGEWANNSNLSEAKKVVELIVDHYLHGDLNLSLGVVAMNGHQQNLIERLIAKRAQEDPEFGMVYNQVMGGDLEKTLIVRNIENIQGDERDIIIFSVTYARDIKGNTSGRFGLINYDGGENRLNVAITRAKQGMRIVASLYPSEMAGDEQNDGVYFFKRYLEYAHEISQGNLQGAKSVLARMNKDYKMSQDSQRLKFDSIFEEEVYNSLSEKGYRLITQVGESSYRIDLGVVDPNNPNSYLMGIECDGAMYHSSKTARERDVTRQRFLEKQGWTIERVWSRNWWKHPQKEVARIEQRIQEEMKKRLAVTS